MGVFAVMPHNVLYPSVKLFVLNLTKGLHMELAGTGVRVQAVCPGFIDSHFHENAGMHVDKSKKEARKVFSASVIQTASWPMRCGIFRPEC